MKVNGGFLGLFRRTGLPAEISRSDPRKVVQSILRFILHMLVDPHGELESLHGDAVELTKQEEAQPLR